MRPGAGKTDTFDYEIPLSVHMQKLRTSNRSIEFTFEELIELKLSISDRLGFLDSVDELLPDDNTQLNRNIINSILRKISDATA